MTERKADVSQADRDAAAEYLYGYAPENLRSYIMAMANGQQDDAKAVQAFARHADKARQEEREICAKIAENFAAARPLGDGVVSNLIRGRYQGEQSASNSIAKAIRYGRTHLGTFSLKAMSAMDDEMDKAYD